MCVVGSGAGGGVIAATLAQRGLKVVVLEAAGYFNESDFRQLELQAYQEMYWRGGPTPTADGNVSLQAGHHARRRHDDQLDQLPAHARLGAASSGPRSSASRASTGPTSTAPRRGARAHRRHRPGAATSTARSSGCRRLRAARLGLRARSSATPTSTSTRPTPPATSASATSPAQAERREDLAARRGRARAPRSSSARRAQRVLVEGGARRRRRGRRTTTTTGTHGAVTVRAPRVVVACGALESPALLLRSGIGGPPSATTCGSTPAPRCSASTTRTSRAWWGPPQAAVCDEFDDTGDGYGFLIEGGAVHDRRIGGSAIPWTGGAEHKAAARRATRTARASSRSPATAGTAAWYVDANGEAVAVLRRHRRARPAQPAATGSSRSRACTRRPARAQIFVLAGGMPTWRRGDDLDAFIAGRKQIPLRAGGYKLFSAHQMGTCRMGTDPATSVANPWGELHDTPGVWIGDGSAFPTPSGTNPMVSIMALAHRTAEAIAGDARRAARDTRDRTDQASWRNEPPSSHAARVAPRAGPDRPRPALHRRRVGRAVRRRHDRRHRRGDGGR